MLEDEDWNNLEQQLAGVGRTARDRSFESVRLEEFGLATADENKVKKRKSSKISADPAQIDLNHADYEWNDLGIDRTYLSKLL
jgi:hypothetical protein